MTIIVEKDRAEPLVFYPSFSAMGVPSAADIRIGTPSTSMPDEGSETALTVDAVSTTLSSSADRGSSTVVVASATGIVAGRRYLLTHPTSKQRHIVLVAGISGTSIAISEPLLSDVASASTFEGIACTVVMTTGQTSQTGPGRAIVRMTIDGVQRRQDHDLRVVVRKFPITLTPDKLLAARKDVRRMRDPTDLPLDETITQAWDTELRPRLRARSINEENILVPSEVERPHIEACLLLLMRAAGQSIEAITDQELRLKRVVDDLLASSSYWYETSETDTATSSGAVDGIRMQDPHAIVWLTR